MAKFITATFKETPLELRSIVIEASKRHDLKAIQWGFDLFDGEKKAYKDDYERRYAENEKRRFDNAAGLASARYGFLPGLELVYKRVAGQETIGDFFSACFVSAAEGGHPQVLRWLTSTIPRFVSSQGHFNKVLG